MKKTVMAGALAALTLAAAGGVAVAQQGATQAPGPRAMRADADGDSRISQAEFVGQRVQRLTAADANRDGSVTPEEMRAVAQARMAGRADARFQGLDANSDGAISRAEFDAAHAARAEARPDRGAGAARMHRGAGRMAHHGQGAGQRGPVSIAEAQGKAEQAFTRLDADRDGFITVAERHAGMQAGRERRHERMTERRAARQGQRQASPPAPASE
ncbi:EF-hand domain-containing protein [Brevundimonas sp.]|uniref:EF-hand domain-containing protein n=1 Tax=Brevundimonas sp. TaxID=1871086 RepID=UPI003564F7EE